MTPVGHEARNAIDRQGFCPIRNGPLTAIRIAVHLTTARDTDGQIEEASCATERFGAARGLPGIIKCVPRSGALVRNETSAIRTVIVGPLPAHDRFSGHFIAPRPPLMPGLPGESRCNDLHVSVSTVWSQKRTASSG